MRTFSNLKSSKENVIFRTELKMKIVQHTLQNDAGESCNITIGVLNRPLNLNECEDNHINYNCKHFLACLRLAIYYNWPQFSCEPCSLNSSLNKE